MNAVFFDFDGTLFDTKADLAATVNHTRRDLGLAELPEEQVLAHVGKGARYLLEHAIPEAIGGDEVEKKGGGGQWNGKNSSVNLQPSTSTCSQPPTFDLQPLLDLFMSHYAEHCVERVEPYPNVRRTLDELRDRGWLLGVNTNKPNFAVKLILEKFGFARYFGAAVVAGGDGIPLKPDAQSIRECASRMRGHRLSSHDWMVGDSWIDMQCAADAGVKGAFIAYGLGRINDARFTVKINRFEELLRYLKAEE